MRESRIWTDIGYAQDAYLMIALYVTVHRTVYLAQLEPPHGGPLEGNETARSRPLIEATSRQALGSAPHPDPGRASDRPR